MDINKFRGKAKPIVDEVPGLELCYNEELDIWSYRPIFNYSNCFISENQFVPPQNEVGKIDNCRNIDLAKKKKDDEFYTKFNDIVRELSHYRDFFHDKIVYCPCDKVFNKGRSEFVNYFMRVSKSWGIKELIFTQYNPYGKGYMWKITRSEMTDGQIMDEHDVSLYLLDGNGDFASPECVDIMANSDIIVTNPPFSHFRKFVAQIMNLDKKFLIIGNKNAITYKEIYPLIKDNKIWLGYTSPFDFDQPEGAPLKKLTGLTRWFTNLPHNKRLNDTIDIWKEYNPEDYFTYDNYDNAIECGHFKSTNHSVFKNNWEGSVDDIPDYDGIMGVPITFLDVYNPNQFEIIGFRKGKDKKDLNFKGYSPYFRILIKRKQ